MKFHKYLTYCAFIALIFLPAINLNAQDTTKIAIWGDSRENLDSACERITAILLHDETDWNIQIHTGDFTHRGRREDWERTLGFKDIGELYAPGKMLLCTSNHDAASPESRKLWDEYTAGILPTNSTDSSTHFYGYHRGNVYVAVCDGYFTDSLTMQSWLDRFLADVKPDDWLIGVWHNPSFAGITYKDSYQKKSLPWLKSLQRHGGDFVVNGHAHVYVRTMPLDVTGNVDTTGGIVHIINGTGGASWEGPIPPNPRIAFTPETRSFPCITFLTFIRNTVSLKTIDARPDAHRKVIDEWKWTR
jgi:large repetitive protein